MNPELPAPQATPENKPPQQQSGEFTANNEAVGEQSHESEQSVQRGENQPSQTPPPVPVPAPTVVSLPTIPTPSAQDDTSTPTIAADDDLIEKEWVDKAKQIIAETQNDPFRREQEVNRLQADYLRKRYGKELGTSN